MAQIEIKGLTVTYVDKKKNETVALENLDASFPSGKFCAVTGLSGSGKSTLLKAIGGGLSIFALVAAMLGLFGSPVIPKVVRLDSLNYFNYTTIISMFDIVSIMEGTTAFIWKFGVLLVLGIIGTIADSVKFIKKDLPL